MTYITKVHRKKKQNTYTLVKILKRYKNNIITTDLHQAENITSNMKEEIQTICKSILKLITLDHLFIF